MTRTPDSPADRGPPARRRVTIGTLAIDAVRLAEALDLVELLVERGRGDAVFTPNVDHVVLAERDPAFRAAYASADLSLADGTPLVWCSRLLRDPLPEKVSGSDLVLPLLNRAAVRGWRVYLLGAAPGVAELAARRLRGEVAGLAIVGVDAPEVSAEPRDPGSAGAVARIREAAPHLVLVALGAPKQELWIHRHLAELRPAVAVGVGASLDFIAGRARRAPPWVSAAGLEWLFRLAHEPRRLWRRYLVQDLRFAPLFCRQLLRHRSGSRPR